MYFFFLLGSDELMKRIMLLQLYAIFTACTTLNSTRANGLLFLLSNAHKKNEYGKFRKGEQENGKYCQLN